MNGISISEVAKKSNVNIETVRYYERRGLIPEPPRTESGYRVFSLEIVERIKFIKRSQELGFTLDEIEKLLAISEDEAHFDSEEVLQFTTQKIRDIELQIQDLEKIKSALEDLSAKCPGSGYSICKCPIIESLSKGGDKNG
ncbi:MAG: Hg(II)-responsive transcriptional regulator [Clostridiales bacterium 43-6]|nr:MAG: Hg(II)-responsive transcriptional regulator [Clostridiales bacterium 43-6]